MKNEAPPVPCDHKGTLTVRGNDHRRETRCTRCTFRLVQVSTELAELYQKHRRDTERQHKLGR